MPWRRCSRCWLGAKNRTPWRSRHCEGSSTSEPDFLGYRYIPLAAYATGGAHAAVAAVPHENRVLLAVGTSVELVDPDTGESSGTFSRPFAYQELPSVLRVSADGTRAVQLLVTAGPRCPPACRYLVVYDLASRLHVGDPIAVPFRATDVAISHDGSVVAASGGEDEAWDVATWDATSGRRLARAHRGASAVAFGVGDHAYLGTRKALCTRSMHAPSGYGGRSPRREASRAGG